MTPVRLSYVAIALGCDFLLLVGLYVLAPLVSPEWDGKVLNDDGLFFVAKMFFFFSLGYKLALKMSALEAVTPVVLVVVLYCALVPGIDAFWIRRFALFLGLPVMAISGIIAIAGHATKLKQERKNSDH